MSISRVAVVGAGILGVAAAREVTTRFPDAEITVFDKAENVAAHQSGHTSGIVDSGLDQEPGSAEAKLTRRGLQLLIPYMAEAGVPYRECGQLLIAQNTDEAERLEEIFARAEDNEVPGVRLLERHEIGAVEPAVRGVLGLFSPHAAITDFSALTAALASDVRAAGGTFRFGSEVTGFDTMSNEVRLRGRPVPADDSPAGDGAAAGETGEDDRGTDQAGDQAGSSEGADDRDRRDDQVHDRDRRDDQVRDRPRTYRGEEGREPVIGIADELRDRFGQQDWFKQAESTLGEWTQKVSDAWANRDGSRPGDSGSRTGGAGSRAGDAPSGRSRSEAPAEEVLGTFDIVIVCAGLQADRLAVAAGLDAEPRIVPFTSDFYRSSATDTEVVRGIIGSVPDPPAPFTETSIVRGLDDGLVLGPNTFVALGREAYDRHGFDLADITSTARSKGFWKFAAQTAKTAARGVKPRVSKTAFVDGIRRFVPELDPNAVAPGARGVRAQAMTAEGELIDELTMTRRGRLTVVRSVPKWAATSALAIAETIVDRAFENAAR
ncbi:FAD-dependent oxidoreductase [Brevibacterium sp. JSBI002]|uniref:FAD-dependent oxidoreductase n=1 Tax=Brevibacterium sp. JSBI002 TaxID=2886045 RepID=UPI002230CB6F|nr:FAD-dependent oxidoreductase [Brevibacterium sp. JSBI002]UZD62575.1 FAD-dependent oxidoreductase [Brevibacterium sp. JSBI002]